MSVASINITISGVSVSGDIDTAHQPVTIDLGNSDRIGQIKFSLQNKNSTYSSLLFSGNALVQADLIRKGTTTTLFRGTLEDIIPSVDVKTGMVAEFVGYDYAQELLGLISPDARQRSILTNSGTLAIMSGDQGIGSQQGMDLVLYVSGITGSGSTGSITSGAQLNLFMSQYYGKSGDTTGSNSGLSFSFKPYISGISTSGTNPFYRTFYVQDAASDTNANYWIPYDTLKAKHETAWEVLRKLTRQGYVVDRSGFKVQFELYVDTSGGLNLRTSGTANFVASGISLIYYLAGTSGSANNNLLRARTPFNTVNLKNFVVGWFPTWTTYPLTDDYSDVIAYSGAYWSGAALSGGVALSGNAVAPNSQGFISIMATNTSGGNSGNVSLVFTLWSGYTLNIARWNTSGGAGVALTYALQASIDSTPSNSITRQVAIYDNSGAYILKSGGLGSSNALDSNILFVSGWGQYVEMIYSASGTFLSGTGRDGGWIANRSGGTAVSGNTINRSGSPDLTNVKQISIGFGNTGGSPSTPNTYTLLLDNIAFQFAYNFSPVTAFNSGSIGFGYGRRYQVFDFPYEVTDSGAAGIITAELQSKMFSRQLGEFIVKDNPNLEFSAQTGITPGQVFVVDAPSMATGSGQYFYYWRASEVKHEWSHTNGFRTIIRAYPWFSGATVQSGLNLINYSLPLPAPLPRAAQQMPIQWLTGQAGVRVPVPR